MWPLLWPALQAIAAACFIDGASKQAACWSHKMTDDVQLSAGYHHQGKLQFLGTPALLSMTRRLVALVVQNAFRDNYTEHLPHAVANGKITFNRREFLAASLKF